MEQSLLIFESSALSNILYLTNKRSVLKPYNKQGAAERVVASLASPPFPYVFNWNVYQFYCKVYSITIAAIGSLGFMVCFALPVLYLLSPLMLTHSHCWHTHTYLLSVYHLWCLYFYYLHRSVLFWIKWIHPTCLHVQKPDVSMTTICSHVQNMSRSPNNYHLLWLSDLYSLQLGILVTGVCGGCRWLCMRTRFRLWMSLMASFFPLPPNFLLTMTSWLWSVITYTWVCTKRRSVIQSLWAVSLTTWLYSLCSGIKSEWQYMTMFITLNMVIRHFTVTENMAFGTKVPGSEYGIPLPSHVVWGSGPSLLYLQNIESNSISLLVLWMMYQIHTCLEQSLT